MPTPIEASGLPWLWERARREPDKFALRCEDQTLSFGELAEKAETAAARLAALGIRAGDRVALLMDASVRTVELIHAAQCLGAILVPLNTRLTAPEIAALAEACEPHSIIYDAAHAGSLKELRPRYARLVESAAEFDSLETAELPAIGRIEPHAVHTIVFTSGTTGTPKGAMLTNGNHFASAIGSRSNLGVEPCDKWLALLPLHHVGGLSIILRSAIDGVGVVLHRRFNPRVANRALRDEKITLLSVVATMLARMLDDNGEQPYPSSLRCVLVGGGPVSGPLLERAARLGVPAAPTYGLTETASQVATARPREAISGAESGARPLPGTEIRIDHADAAGRGEVVVKGPTVMAGYFREPEGTRAVVRNGWLHTGDIGRFDANGFLHIDGRRSDLIVTGGENVYPAEVEAVLTSHPLVAEAAVYAASDPDWGHRVAAAVVLRAGAHLGESDLRSWCGPRLARFKIPKSIRFVDALPRTASGKIKRGLLRNAKYLDR